MGQVPLSYPCARRHPHCDGHRGRQVGHIEGGSCGTVGNSLAAVADVHVVVDDVTVLVIWGDPVHQDLSWGQYSDVHHSRGTGDCTEGQKMDYLEVSSCVRFMCGQCSQHNTCWCLLVSGIQYTYNTYWCLLALDIQYTYICTQDNS